MPYNWTQTSSTSVNYLNLPSGRHTFHLQSTDGDGVWSPQEVLLSIEVTPHFFESIWGWLVIFAGSVLLLLVCLLLYRRFYQLRHHLDLEREMTDIKLRFFTDISHELRTPLTLIDGPVSELLDDDGIQGQSRRHLESIRRNTRHMLSLVNQILDFRKIQNAKMNLLLECLSIEDTVSDVMENFNELAVQHHITFGLHTDRLHTTDKEPVLIWIDRDKVEKICFNLLSNAFKYTPDGKSITVSVEELPDEVAIHFSDEGCGIDANQMERIFRRFETVAHDNLFKPSSGIGLSLVKQFTDLHHGRVEVQSVPEQGSTFTIVFSKGRKQFEHDTQVQFLAADLQISDFSTEKESGNDNDDNTQTCANDIPIILVVEDNVELRSFIREILQNDYQVIEAGDGVEGLEKARQYWPSMILCDVMMPQMDGFQLTEAVRNDLDIYAIPIILLTAKSQIDDRVKGIDLGADDYIIKPFSSKYLKARISNILQQQQRFKKQLLSEMGDIKDGQTAFTQGSGAKLTAADQLFIQELQAYMDKNMDNSEISVNGFATALSMGRSRFARKIKQLFDLTPIGLIQVMRLKRACQLLEEGEFNISEVAYQTGFTDPKYFTRCFRKHFGKSPKEYLTEKAESKQ